MTLKMRFKDGSRPPIWLGESRITIGSDRSNSVWLQQQLIEPFHAEIRIRNGKAYLLNLQPEYRTGVNGIKVVKALQLSPGDEVIIGRTELAIFDQPPPVIRSPQQGAAHGESDSAGSSAGNIYDSIDDDFDRRHHMHVDEDSADDLAKQSDAPRPEQISFDSVLAELNEEQDVELPEGKSSYAVIVVLIMLTLAVISTVLVLTGVLE